MENDAMSSQYLTLSASFMYHPVMLYSVRYFYPSLPSLRGTKTLLSSMRARLVTRWAKREGRARARHVLTRAGPGDPRGGPETGRFGLLLNPMGVNFAMSMR